MANIKKSIIKLGWLLFISGAKSLTFASFITQKINMHTSSPVKIDTPEFSIKANTTRLPEYFREKFRIGKYKINESDGDIRIKNLEMDQTNQQKIVNAIQKGERFFNFNNKEEEIIKFLENFTQHDNSKIVVYLEVGSGMYFYQELFEKLIIAQNGTIITRLKHGYKKPFGNEFYTEKGLLACLKDDRNILKKLDESLDLSEAFQAGKAKIFVYHKLCRSLTSLYFDRHDKDVFRIDAMRAFFMRSKSAAIWSAAWQSGAFLGNAIGYVPLLSSVLGPVLGLATTFAGCMAIYKTYQLLCPENLKTSINAFVDTKVKTHIPFMGKIMQKN